MKKNLFVYSKLKLTSISIIIKEAAEKNTHTLKKETTIKKPNYILKYLSYLSWFRSQKLVSLTFTFFRRDKKLNNCLILLKVRQDYILVTSKFTVIGVLNFQ